MSTPVTPYHNPVRWYVDMTEETSIKGYDPFMALTQLGAASAKTAPNMAPVYEMKVDTATSCWLLSLLKMHFEGQAVAVVIDNTLASVEFRFLSRFEAAEMTLHYADGQRVYILTALRGLPYEDAVMQLMRMKFGAEIMQEMQDIELTESMLVDMTARFMFNVIRVVLTP